MGASSLIFDPAAAGRPLRVAAFMSGSGTNVIKLLETPDPAFEVAFIFSDTATDKCRGQEIARRFDLPYFAYDVRRFHEKRGLKRSVKTAEGLAARREYDQVAAKLIAGLRGGPHRPGRVHELPHPHRGHQRAPGGPEPGGRGRRAHLRGRRRGHGRHPGRARRAALLHPVHRPGGGLRPPAHGQRPHRRGAARAPGRATGRPGAPAPRWPTPTRSGSNRAGDWVVFPKTVQLIAQGRLGLSEGGVVTLDGEPRPGGVRPAEAWLGPVERLWLSCPADREFMARALDLARAAGAAGARCRWARCWWTRPAGCWPRRATRPSPAATPAPTPRCSACASAAARPGQLPPHRLHPLRDPGALPHVRRGGGVGPFGAGGVRGPRPQGRRLRLG